MLHAIYFALLTSFGMKTYANKFTVLAEYLLETHQRLKNDLDFHIKEEEKRLSILKIYFKIFAREHEKAMNDIPSYLGNAINAFTLIKRLTSDLHYIKTHVKNGAEYARNLTRYHDGVKYPSQMDLIRAAEAIARPHPTYNLDVKQLAEGNLTNSTYSSSMTAGDCYELGRALFHTKDFANGIVWMSEALRKYNEENFAFRHPLTVIRVYEYISNGYYELGDLKSSLQWLRNILDLDPNNSRVKQLAQKRIDYENMTIWNNCFNAEEWDRDDSSREKSCNFICLGRTHRNIQQCSLKGFPDEFKNCSSPAT